MRWVHRFPSVPNADTARWVTTSLGRYDLGWPVDELLLVPVQDRWALIGRWFDGEPVVDDLDDLEFEQRDEAILFALCAGVPVRDADGLLAMPLKDSPEQAAWRRQVRLDHLSGRLRQVDALIDQYPTNFHIRAWKESLIQRWHRVAHPHRRSPSLEPRP